MSHELQQLLHKYKTEAIVVIAPCWCSLFPTVSTIQL